MLPCMLSVINSPSKWKNIHRRNYIFGYIAFIYNKFHASFTTAEIIGSLHVSYILHLVVQ